MGADVGLHATEGLTFGAMFSADWLLGQNRMERVAAAKKDKSSGHSLELALAAAHDAEHFA
ncbi:MAG TPA: hypothetical protein VKB50_23555 [Vicinamibacterales bacterium]|nr:hypothetical protein [Vicinamibacterales bacterium]